MEFYKKTFDEYDKHELQHQLIYAENAYLENVFNKKISIQVNLKLWAEKLKKNFEIKIEFDYDNGAGYFFKITISKKYNNFTKLEKQIFVYFDQFSFMSIDNTSDMIVAEINNCLETLPVEKY